MQLKAFCLMALPLFRFRLATFLIFFCGLCNAPLSAAVGDLIWYLEAEKSGVSHVFTGELGTDGLWYDIQSVTVPGSDGEQNDMLVKYDSFGRIVWNQSIARGDESGTVFDKTLDHADNFYLVGYFSGALGYSSQSGPVYRATSIGETDAFILKYNRDGNIEWGLTKSFIDSERASETQFLEVTPLPDGSIAVYRTEGSWPGIETGFLERYSPAGDLLWSKEFDALVEVNELKALPSGDLIVSGLFDHDFSYNGGPKFFQRSDHNLPFVARIRSDGALGWVKEISRHVPNEPSYQYHSFNGKTVIDTLGNIFVFGDVNFDEFQTGFIIKLDQDGNNLVAKDYNARPTDLALDEKNGKIYVGFYLAKASVLTESEKDPLTTFPESRAVLAAFDSNLSLIWKEHTGGYGNQGSSRVKISEDGHLYWRFHMESSATYSAEPACIKMESFWHFDHTHYVIAKVSLDPDKGTQMSIPFDEPATTILAKEVKAKLKLNLNWDLFARSSFKLKFSLDQNPFAPFTDLDVPMDGAIRLGDAVLLVVFGAKSNKAKTARGYKYNYKIRGHFNSRKKTFRISVTKVDLFGAFYRNGISNTDLSKRPIVIPFSIEFPEQGIHISGNAPILYSSKADKKGVGKGPVK